MVAGLVVGPIGGIGAGIIVGLFHPMRVGLICIPLFDLHGPTRYDLPIKQEEAHRGLQGGYIRSFH
ncbi:MAG: hypothetical protein AB7S37_01410 [Methanobacteriales archaeon]|jgi:hypothetical protein|nr:hypothetical protein [Methanothermobacter sp.]HOQ20397.1 hypothetical protein [Methanothermobacter sp.]